MKRRDLLRAVGAAGASTAVAGCGAGSILSDCGPGDVEIETLADGGTAGEATADGASSRIEGTVVSIEQTGIVIDDGTGRARVLTFDDGFDTRNVDEGDCVRASGIAVPSERRDLDIEFLAEEVEFVA